MIWMDVDAALAEVPVNAMPLIDATDFKTIEDAVVYNQAGLALFWNFITTAGAQTCTAVTPTSGGTHDWTDQGTSGMYAIAIPAAAGASINNDTEGFGWFTGMATGVLPWAGPIIGFRAAALNNSLIDAGTTGLLAPTTAARTLDVSAGGEAGIDWANVGSPTTANALTSTTIATTQKVDVETIKTNPVVNAGTITFPTTATLASTTNITGGTITTVTNLTNAPTNGDLTAVMKTSVTTAATAATPTISTLGANTITAASIAADAITDAKVAADVTIASVTGAVGSVTGNVGGNVTGSVGSVTGAVGSVTGAVGSVTGAVGSVTGNVGGNVVGSVGSVTGLTAADVGAIKVITDALTAAAAAKLAASALGLITGTVDTTGFAATATEFEADDITEATADHYIGRIVTFTSGAMLGQATDITDYALAAGRGHFTVTALTEAPANNVTFVIT